MNYIPPRSITEHDKPISELYRLAAMEHVKAERKARELEEGKSIVISEMMNKLCEEDEKLSQAKAERTAKGSDQYKSYIRRMHDARTEANLRKVDAEVLKMQHGEFLMFSAAARDERRLG